MKKYSTFIRKPPMWPTLIVYTLFLGMTMTLALALADNAKLHDKLDTRQLACPQVPQSSFKPLSDKQKSLDALFEKINAKAKKQPANKPIKQASMGDYDTSLIQYLPPLPCKKLGVCK